MINHLWRGLKRLAKPLVMPIEAALIKRIAHQVPYTETDSSDVFIVSFPRSGNTWFRTLTAGAVYNIDVERVTPRLLDTLVPDTSRSRYYTRFDTPMYFKSHAFPTPEYKRVVYILRDGRDALVSYWHHCMVRWRKPIDFLRLVKGGNEPPEDLHWHEHVEAWLANPYGADMLVIKYEDLMADTVTQLKRFCAFAGIERGESLLAAVARAASFEKLQEKEGRYGWEAHYQPGTGEYFIRRGEIGSHKDEMPPDVLAAFMEKAGDTLRKCGYLATLAQLGFLMPSTISERFFLFM